MEGDDVLLRLTEIGQGVQKLKTHKRHRACAPAVILWIHPFVLSREVG